MFHQISSFMKKRGGTTVAFGHDAECNLRQGSSVRRDDRTVDGTSSFKLLGYVIFVASEVTSAGMQQFLQSHLNRNKRLHLNKMTSVLGERKCILKIKVRIKPD